MEELAPFVRVGGLVGAGFEVLVADAVGLGGAVDELEDERTTRDDTITSGQATDK